MLSTDVVQLRRFATGLDTPDGSTNEFQRADCAPLATLGDASINATDVVQGRRYATGLDPFNQGGGPLSRTGNESGSFDDGASRFTGRELRVGTATLSDKGSVRIPVAMRAYGDETAVSFTLAFDEATLRNARVTLGPAAPAGSVLTVNAEKGGRIAILIDSSEPMIASGVPVDLIYVELDIAASSDRATIPIAFTGDLAGRATSDAYGRSLWTEYTDGVIVLDETRERVAVDRGIDLWFIARPMLPLVGTSLSFF